VSAWLVVLAKEVTDSLRDRRTLFAALLMGPLFGPLMLAAIVSLTVERSLERSRETVELPVIGLDRAPNLAQRLRAADLLPVAFEGDMAAARAAVHSGRERLVLRVPEDFGARLAAGRPAPLELVRDSADREGAEAAARVRAAIAGWSGRLAAMRVQVRGLSPDLLAPLVLHELDVATPASRALLFLGMITYFLLFATLMGGMYLAIDATAGERERGSLEPLLSLPVPRQALIAGKLAATTLFMLAALALSLAAFAASLSVVPFAELGMRPNAGPAVLAGVFLVLVPFAMLGAALLTFVASFTRSYREAQSWLSGVLIVPTVPIAFAGIVGLEPSPAAMLVPSLSQHLLVTELLKGAGVNALHAAISVASSLALAALLALAVRRRYCRESILGV
jgi:sodium transport system permease protein